MNATAVRTLSVLAVVVFCFVSTSCSSGPEPPKPGSPAFFWAAAKETYAAGDYQQTIQHLYSVCKTQNEFTAKAQPWYLILTSGMTRGYVELADTFEIGARANRANPTPFRREMTQYRTFASRLALQFAEAFENMEKNYKFGAVTLDFPFPTGSAIPTPQLSRIGKGEIPGGAVLDDIRRSTLQTYVLLETCRAVGAPDDTAKAQEAFKSGSAQVPRDVFYLEMARNLNDQSQMFSRAKLDQPERLKLFNTHALDVAKTLPETKDSKALIGKIEKSLKLVKN